MIKSPRFPVLTWFMVMLCAFGFLGWINTVRIQHIAYVSALGGWSERPPAASASAASSLSGLGSGNGLIVPENLTESYHWLAQTQHMFSRSEWRVRHIDYENAPFGRAVNSVSPYRWWLGAIAWCDHAVSGRTTAQSVERAALLADPLLHFLLLLATASVVAWRFGVFPAALISTGLVFVFPFASEFLPGAPDDRGMAHIFAIWSVLPLLVGVSATSTSNNFAKATCRWFFLAGTVGGLGLWVGVSGQVPVIVGVVVGALLAAWVAGKRGQESAAITIVLPWRAWAAGGAGATLAAYLIEFAPSHLGNWNLGAIHPLYGLAWLGAGEVLAQTSEWIHGKKTPRSFRNVTVLALAGLAIAALPAAGWKIHDHGFLDPTLSAFRLTKLPEGAVAENLGAWISRDGLSAPVLAALLPLLLVAPAVWLLVRRKTDNPSRVSVAMALGPVLVAFGFACRQLVWWNALDGLLLVMVVAMTCGWPGVTGRRNRCLAGFGFLLLLLLPGTMQIASRAGGKEVVTRPEVLGLIERDLAGWIALHADPRGAVVLAPPNETTALCYYGGMRGIGTLSWENKDGVTAAMRILSAPSVQEAKALIDERGITHIVLLSWDSHFDDYARLGTGKIEGTFREQLRFSTLPLWLRPRAYQLPTIAGFEGQSVTILEVIEEQSEATALGRIAAYFVEMGELDQAAAAAQGLRRFPGDLGAWAARAEVELARDDEAAFARSLKALQAMLNAKNVPVLPWDRGVHLSVVLAKAKQMKLSREQMSLCLATADEQKLRMLSTGSLYRLLVLSRAFGLSLDSKLADVALDMLPGDQRDRLRAIPAGSPSAIPGRDNGQK